MKYLISVDKVRIELNSQWNEKSIESFLMMLAHVLNGVDYGGQWEVFANLLLKDIKVLKKLLEV